MLSPEDADDAAQGLDADATGIIARPDTDHPACPGRGDVGPGPARVAPDRTITRTPPGEGEGYARPETHGDIRGQYGPYGQDAYGSTYKQGYQAHLNLWKGRVDSWRTHPRSVGTTLGHASISEQSDPGPVTASISRRRIDLVAAAMENDAELMAAVGAAREPSGRDGEGQPAAACPRRASRNTAARWTPS